MGPAQGSMAPGAAQLMSLTSSFLVFAQEERSTETVEELLLDLCGEADLNGARGSAWWSWDSTLQPHCCREHNGPGTLLSSSEIHSLADADWGHVYQGLLPESGEGGRTTKADPFPGDRGHLWWVTSRGKHPLAALPNLPQTLPTNAPVSSLRPGPHLYYHPVFTQLPACFLPHRFFSW